MNCLQPFMATPNDPTHQSITFGKDPFGGPTAIQPLIGNQETALAARKPGLPAELSLHTLQQADF